MRSYRLLVGRTFLSALLLFAASLTLAAEPKPATDQDLFIAGTEGYASYRIPGLVITTKGTLLAYCEARKNNASDWGKIDIVSRRSTDGGQTWSKQQLVGKLPTDVKKNAVSDPKKLGGADNFTMNNPLAIATRDGKIHFLYCVEYARCFAMHSDDDGQTFSEPVEITATFGKFHDDYAWKVLATGPGHGIELKSGRLVVPIWLALGTNGAHRPSAISTIASDDGGKTWQRGEIIVKHGEAVANPSEAAVVELADGRVMINMRSESKPNRRLVSISPDGLTKWSEAKFDATLHEPICMASLVRVDARHIAFLNPDNLLKGDKPGTDGQGRDRKNLTIRLSDDEGKSWRWSRAIEPGVSAYSDLAVDKTGGIHCFYELGRGAQATLHWKKIDAAWIKEGNPN